MSGRVSRSKGRRGQLAFSNLLTEHDWEIRELNAGKAVEDLWAVDPNGKLFSVEIKNTANIQIDQFRKQAMRQAGNVAWMLACKISNTSSWLVLRKGERPVVWHERGN